MQLKGSVQE